MTADDNSKLNAIITRRLHAFHDALVERGQIQPHSRISPPEAGGIEVAGIEIANHCTEERAA